MNEVKFGPEDVIYNEKDSDHDLYIILEGEIEIYHKTVNGTKNTL